MTTFSSFTLSLRPFSLFLLAVALVIGLALVTTDAHALGAREDAGLYSRLCGEGHEAYCEALRNLNERLTTPEQATRPVTHSATTQPVTRQDYSYLQQRQSCDTLLYAPGLKPTNCVVNGVYDPHGTILGTTTPRYTPTPQLGTCAWDARVGGIKCVDYAPQPRPTVTPAPIPTSTPAPEITCNNIWSRGTLGCEPGDHYTVNHYRPTEHQRYVPPPRTIYPSYEPRSYTPSTWQRYVPAERNLYRPVTYTSGWYR